MRRVSDGAIRKLLLLRCKNEVQTHVIEVDVGVVCHNQRSLTVSLSVQLQETAISISDDLLTGSVSSNFRAQITFVSEDVILDVGKSWSACVIGEVLEDRDLNSLQRPAHVVIGGWGLQTIQM
jgi:hypothetical protein